MKDYKEMTESVLQQAKTRAAHQKHQRRMATGLIAASLCLAVLIAAVGFGVGGNPADTTQPTISLENPTTVPATQPTETEPTQPETTAPKEEIVVTTGNVYFLSATEDAVSLTPVQANMTFPIAHIFRVWDLRGMTADEKYKTKLEAIEFQDEFRKKYMKLCGEGRYETYSGDDLVMQQLSAGFTSIVILDNSQVESVEKETTGVFDLGGSYAVHHEDVTIGEGEYAVTLPAGSKRIFLHLQKSLETQHTFSKDPSTPLSTLSDTITVTIHYKNGTKEIVVIDVTIDDDGQVYMTQRGNNTGV